MKKQIYFVLNAHEGWNLYDTTGSGSGEGRLQIQWHDEQRQFIEARSDDHTAIEFVIASALEGSQRHQWALGQIKKYNDQEWERVCSITYMKFEIGESEIPTREMNFNFF